MDEKLKRYQGIFPAFYACYDDTGRVSTSRTKSLAKYLLAKGVTGLYVGGSSGECIYQSVEERKTILEAVMDAVGGKLVVIAHVACNNTADSCELARHAESLGVDAIAAIPPIYFHLPPYAIADYWNAISAAAPNTDFIIYNIPQLAGVALSTQLLQEMAKNPRVIGVKNSSMPTQDIQMWRDATERELVVFNGRMELAREIQNECCRIIYKMCSCHGNLYAVMKEILRREGMDVGTVRAPLPNLVASDMDVVSCAQQMIEEAVQKYVKA